MASAPAAECDVDQLNERRKLLGSRRRVLAVPRGTRIHVHALRDLRYQPSPDAQEHFLDARRGLLGVGEKRRILDDDRCDGFLGFSRSPQRDEAVDAILLELGLPAGRLKATDHRQRVLVGGRRVERFDLLQRFLTVGRRNPH